MANYLTIPEVTDAEDLISYSAGSSDHEFTIVINVGATAVWLFQASANGTLIPLVVLATDGPTLALDEVVVSSAQSGGDAYMTFTLDAKDVRFF
ncbi:MAG: hypothetical protein ABI658_28315 [Acidimicrobiales bacterium]